MIKRLSFTELRKNASALRANNHHDPIYTNYFKERKLVEIEKEMKQMSPAELTRLIDAGIEIRNAARQRETLKSFFQEF